MILKLTTPRAKNIVLIGTESIIDMHAFTLKPYDTKEEFPCTKIESRGAMVTTNYVQETVEEIWVMIEKATKDKD